MPSSFPWAKKGAKKHDSDDHARTAPPPPGYAAAAAAADPDPDTFYRAAGQQPPESYYPHPPLAAASTTSSDPAAAADYYNPSSRYASTAGTPDSKSLRDKASIGSASDLDTQPSRANKLFGRRQSVRRDRAPGEASQDPRLPQVQESTPASAQPRVSAALAQRGNRASQYLAYHSPVSAERPDSASDPRQGEEVIDQYLQRLQPQLADQRFDVQRRNRKAQLESLAQPSLDAADQPHYQAPQHQHSHAAAPPPPPPPHGVDYPPPGYQPQAPAPDLVQRKGSVLRKQFVEQHVVRGQSQRLHRRNQSSESIDPHRGLASGPGHESTSPAHPAMSRSNTQVGASEAEPRDAPIATTRQPADMTPDEVAQLVKEYRDLREKYSKVKRYYFEKDDQVKSLQNTLAHQRLAASRTAWDDGEYSQRFTRLDGLISQLAFGFRKDWKSLPTWIQPYVNKDAIHTGKQEMTAVGRAVMSRWLNDEIFDRYFSPALDSKLSTELKTIQHNMRNFHPPFQTLEEEEALNAKIINWRLATIDGLQHMFNTPEAQGNRKALSDALEHSLVEELKEHMHEDPPPAGLEGGVHMIIELAVSILANLPFESRDVHIEYILPGTLLDADRMKIETGIPPLTEPMAPGANLGLVDDDHKSALSAVDAAQQQLQGTGDELGETSDKDKKGFLGGLMSKAKSGNGGGSANQSQTSLAPPSSASKEDATPRVRLCSFLSMEIRGKMNLVKAPVYRA